MAEMIDKNNDKSVDKIQKTSVKIDKKQKNQKNKKLTINNIDFNSNQYLNKHTGTVHISNSLSLLERKIFNVLLMNTITNGNVKDKYYYINLPNLKEMIGYNHNGYEELKESIDKLLTTKIEWNIFGKDKKGKLLWNSATTFLSGRSFSEARGVLKYSFSSELKEVILHPNIYAKLNLIIQNTFQSKHSLVLWEFLVESICSGDNINKTDWIGINDYRKLLGVTADEYKEFKELNRALIKKPLEEINEKSDILAKEEYQKQGHKVVALRFDVTKRNTGVNSLIKKTEQLPHLDPLFQGNTEQLLNVKEVIQNNDLSTSDETGVSQKNSNFNIKNKIEISHINKELSSQNNHQKNDVNIPYSYTSKVGVKNIMEGVNEKNFLLSDDLIQLLKGKLFNCSDNDISVITSFIESQAMNYNETEEAIYAVKENIDSNKIKVKNIMAILRTAMKEKWKPSLNKEARIALERKNRITMLTYQLNRQNKLKQELLSDFNTHLRVLARQFFDKLSEEEKQKRMLKHYNEEELMEKLIKLDAIELVVSDLVTTMNSDNRDKMLNDFQKTNNCFLNTIELKINELEGELNQH